MYPNQQQEPTKPWYSNEPSNQGELSTQSVQFVSWTKVTITSKVYPDKKWTGKISYISNYPKDGQQAKSKTITGGAASSAKYPFTVDITSEIGDSKRSFSVSVEMKNNTKGILVPASSNISDRDKNYVWTVEKGKAEEGGSDLRGMLMHENQEISSGLTKM